MERSILVLTKINWIWVKKIIWPKSILEILNYTSS
jgi:hypothetical protein